MLWEAISKTRTSCSSPNPHTSKTIKPLGTSLFSQCLERVMKHSHSFLIYYVSIMGRTFDQIKKGKQHKRYSDKKGLAELFLTYSPYLKWGMEGRATRQHKFNLEGTFLFYNYKCGLSAHATFRFVLTQSQETQKTINIVAM